MGLFSLEKRQLRGDIMDMYKKYAGNRENRTDRQFYKERQRKYCEI